MTPLLRWPPEKSADCRDGPGNRLIRHELRAPISTMVAVVRRQLGHVAGDAPDLNKDLKIIERAALHALSVIDDKLSLHMRTDPSSQEIARLKTVTPFAPVHASQVISCDDLLEDFVECGTWLCQANDNLLKLQVHGPVPNLIRVGATSVRQVVYNLLANAAQSCTAGTVEIHLSCKRRRGVNSLVILVSDTGSGLSPQQCARIMAGQPIAKPSPYRGLGLRVIKRELARLNGALDVFSTPDTGSSFSIRVPVEVIESAGWRTSAHAQVNYPVVPSIGEAFLLDGPEAEDLERVAEYARSGEITKILQWIEQITTHTPGRKNTDRFIELVHKAANQLDMEMIVQAVQALLKGKPPTRASQPTGRGNASGR